MPGQRSKRPGRRAVRTGDYAVPRATILGRAALTQPAGLDQARQALAVDPARLLIPGVAVTTETNPALAGLVSDVHATAALNTAALIPLAEAIPYPTVALAAVYAAVTRKITSTLPPAADPAERARWLTALGTALAQLGRPAEALPVAEEAVTIRRELAAASPDRHRPDLAASLSALAEILVSLGGPLTQRRSAGTPRADGGCGHAPAPPGAFQYGFGIKPYPISLLPGLPGVLVQPYYFARLGDGLSQRVLADGDRHGLLVMLAQHAHYSGRRGMLAFLLPLAMMRQPAMSRRLISWPRRCSAAATIASSVTATAPIDVPQARADLRPSRVVADVLTFHPR
jgi:hypothetical protein